MDLAETVDELLALDRYQLHAIANVKAQELTTMLPEAKRTVARGLVQAASSTAHLVTCIVQLITWSIDGGAERLGWGVQDNKARLVHKVVTEACEARVQRLGYALKDAERRNRTLDLSLWRTSHEAAHHLARAKDEAARAEKEAARAAAAEVAALDAEAAAARAAEFAAMAAQQAQQQAARARELASEIERREAVGAAARQCCICLDEELHQRDGVDCDGSDGSHFVCDGCLELHVAATAAAPLATRGEGRVLCPHLGCRSHSGSRTVFSDAQLATHLHSGRFAEYITARIEVLEARVVGEADARVQQQVAAQLAR
jgi:hypothetical protein